MAELVESLEAVRNKMEELLVGHSACHPSLIPWRLASLDNAIEKVKELTDGK